MTKEQNPYGFALPDDPRHRDRLAELGAIAGSLVHELKNPLGAIALNIDLLLEAQRQGRSDEAKTEVRLKRIQAGTQHLQDIVQAFLSFARPGKPDLDRVDIGKLLQQIADEQRELLAADHIGLFLHLAEDLSAVPGDTSQLRSVFLNIILNARDALRDDPRKQERRVIIAARNRAQGIRVVIANNGPPLSSSAAAHLFDPFFSAKDGGTGLGLAIVARLVELHHGRVTASSNPDQGVSFTIELPTTLGPAKPRTELPAPDARAFPPEVK
ncbi:MAG: sensor histidine kinase [Planctomycetota bacterium]|nr:MAG: sensor histidine kinase [Planctomycetota bacterium]